MIKKKILYIHHGGANGGAPRSLSFLINLLNRDKYEAVVVCNNDYEKLKEIFEGAGAKVIKVPYLGGWYGSTVSPLNIKTLSYNLKHVIPSYYGIRKVVSQEKPDIIHLNSTCLCFVAKSIRRKYPTLPIVCHVREPLLSGFWGDILYSNRKI